MLMNIFEHRRTRILFKVIDRKEKTTFTEAETKTEERSFPVLAIGRSLIQPEGL